MGNILDLGVFADFYCLQAILSDRRIDQHTDIQSEAATTLARVSQPISNVLADYMYLICMGEARHAVGSTSLEWYWSEIPKSEGRVGAYHFAEKYDPLKVLPQLSSLFDQSGWGGSYGGKKWKNIADVALKFRRGELPPATYIDHVADLKHNGGTQFSKGEVSEVIKFRLAWISDYYKFSSFLDFKRDTKDFFAGVNRNYFRSLSLPVGRLVIRYMQRIRITPPLWEARPPIEYEPFKFGDLELKDKSSGSLKSSAKSSAKSSSKPLDAEPLDESMYLSEDEMYDPAENAAKEVKKEVENAKPEPVSPKQKEITIDEEVKESPEGKGKDSVEFTQWLSDAAKLS